MKKKTQTTKGSAITDDEIRGAEDKFAESLQLAQVGMFNLLENDVSTKMLIFLRRSSWNWKNKLKIQVMIHWVQ